MATCPRCGRTSQSEDQPMTLGRTGRLIANTSATYALAGEQTKISARAEYRLSCHCGWSVVGYVDGGNLIVNPNQNSD